MTGGIFIDITALLFGVELISNREHVLVLDGLRI
jgi:hypothetical protein